MSNHDFSGQSPICTLAEYIAQSPFRIAPEGAAGLQHEVDSAGIVLEFVVDRPGVPRTVLADYNTETKVVRLGTSFLETIWAAANLFLVALTAYQAAQRTLQPIFELEAEPAVRSAYELYRDRLEALASDKPTAWPAGASRPTPSPPESSPVHQANELFLTAVAWILHHELAHARLKHEENAPNSMEQEHAADTEATLKVCQSPANPLELAKRTLGIATAVLVLVARDLQGNRQMFTTHPPTYERLLNSLGAANLDYDHDTYAAAFVILDILLTEAGLTDDLNRDLGMSFDLCFEACNILRERSVVSK